MSEQITVVVSDRATLIGRDQEPCMHMGSHQQLPMCPPQERLEQKICWQKTYRAMLDMEQLHDAVGSPLLHAWQAKLSLSFILNETSRSKSALGMPDIHKLQADLRHPGLRYWEIRVSAVG